MKVLFLSVCLLLTFACSPTDPNENEFKQTNLTAVVSDIRISSEGPRSAELAACGFTAKTENETIVFRIDRYSDYRPPLARCSLLREGDKLELRKNERLHKGKLINTSYVWIAANSTFGSITGNLVLQ